MNRRLFAAFGEIRAKLTILQAISSGVQNEYHLKRVLIEPFSLMF